MSNTYHTFHNPIVVAGSLLKGKSLIRTLFNLSLREWSLKGDVLDLGSKSTTASYYEYLRIPKDVNITFTDFEPSEGVISLDVETDFPFESNSYDMVMAFHLFEHVFNFHKAPHEITRILRPGGRLMVSVPFLHQYHADPDDYFRFTDSGLRRWGELAGLRCIHLEAMGEGIVTAFLTKLPNQILPALFRRSLTTLLYLFGVPLDRLIALRPKVNDRTVPQRFALEFLGIFEKSL